MRIYLLEVIAAVDAIGTEQTFYFAFGKAYNHSSAPAFYPDRIVNPINLARSISTDLRTIGEGQIGVGEIVISNADGAFDELLQHGYGRPARLLSLEADTDYSTAEVIFDGYVEQPTPTQTEISFRFRDKQEELKKSLQTARFAGDNVGGSGLEGQSGDIGGSVKPRLFGKALNILPVLLNSVQLIYGWNFDRNGAAAPSDQILEVRDGGVALTFGTDHANIAALQAAAPAAGHYDTCLAASMIKTGSKATFDLTLDAIEGSGADDNNVAYLVKRILLDAAVPEGRIDDDSFDAFDAAAPYIAGFYAREDVSTFEVVDQLMTSAGGFVQPDGAGVYQLGMVAEPASEALLTLRQASASEKLAADEADIVSLRGVVSNDQGRGVPSWQVSLGYARNWTVQSNFAGSVAVEAQERYRGTELKVTGTDALVQNKYPQSAEMVFSTLLTEQADAETELARRGEMYGTERRMFEIELQYTPELATKLMLGATVEVFSNRYGLADGGLFIITQMEINARVQFAKVTVWG